MLKFFKSVFFWFMNPNNNGIMFAITLLIVVICVALSVGRAI